MSETLSAERYPIEIIQGVEGFCIGLNNYRIAGPKPWGGGTVVKRWHVSLADLGKAIPAVATIEALQAEVTTLRTALEEAAGLFNEMHLPLQGHAATRCTLRTDFCVTAEHVREALHGRE